MRKFNTSISEEERIQRIEDSKCLKHGDIIAIARATGYTKQAVHQFIKGYSNSKRISKAFEQFVKSRKESLEKGIAENL